MRILQRLYTFIFNKTGRIHSMLVHRIPILLNKSEQKSRLNQFLCLSLFSASYLTNIPVEDSVEEDDEEEKTTNVTTPTIFLQKACVDKLNGVSELLLQFSQAVTESAFQYKNSLNELISFLEKHKNVKTEENENALVAVKAKVLDCKKEFLELITLVQSFEKLAIAAAEFSFLVAAETVAMSMSEVVSSIRGTITAELLDVKNVENQYLKMEEALIQDAEL